MNRRGINAQQDDIIEINHPSGLTALKVRVLTGKTGNIQVLTYPQPCARLHVEPKQAEIAQILTEDPADTDQWPPLTLIY